MARSVTGVVAAASVAVLAAGVLTPVGAQAVAGAELSVPVVSADSTPQVRGDIAAGVPVSQVKVLRNGKKITAKIRWNQGLINRKGNSDRFNVRLVVFPTGDGAPIVLKDRSKTKTPPPVQKIRIKLSKNKAKKLRAADDAVLTVSQQHGKTKSKRFNRAYVTVTHLSAKNGRALRSGNNTRSVGVSTRAGRDCMARLIRPGANLAGCELEAASLRDCVISRANLTNVDLRAAMLRGCVVKKTKLAGSDLTGIQASGLIGTPASLPAGWSLVNGTLTAADPTPPAPAAQTITFPALADTALNAPSPALAASASSGLAVSYSTATAPVCDVTTGGVITLVSLGTCTIDAGQAGDSQYLAAPQASQSFEVTQSTQTITFPGLADTAINATAPVPGATASSTLPVDYTTATTGVCTVTGGVITLVSEGTCTIDADQAGDSQYLAAPQASQSFEVTQSTQTITFPVLADTAINATAPVPGATASSTLPVDYTTATTAVCTVTSGGVITLVSEGTCTIDADQAGNGTYAAAAQVSQSFTVTAFVVSCAAGGGAANTCVVGDTGPGGGKVFYVNPVDTPGSNYMEVVVAGMAPAWNDTNGGSYYKWCVGTGETNNVTTGTAIGEGKTNTDNMVVACTSGAANSVRAYTGGGLSAGSWSLPSKDELNALYTTGVGGFAAVDYWSSSQSDASVAWGQYFVNGSQNTDVKDGGLHVRPVRAF